MSGSLTGGQSLEAGDSNRTRESALRGTWWVWQTQRTCQCSLCRTWDHQRAKRRRARTRGALESRVHRAVTATAATPVVSVQWSSHSHGSLSLCRMSGFGAWGGTAWNYRSGWSRSERLWSRRGVTSYHWPRWVTCLWLYAREDESWLVICGLMKNLVMSWTHGVRLSQGVWATAGGRGAWSRKSMVGGRREVDRSSTRSARRGVGFNNRWGCWCSVTTGCLWPCSNDGWGWRRGRRGRGGIGVVRGNHARENRCDGSCRRLLSRRGLGWDWCRRRGPMRDEEGSTVDSRCGVMRIAWFGITWK